MIIYLGHGKLKLTLASARQSRHRIIAKVSFNLPVTTHLQFQFTHLISGLISFYQGWEIENHVSVRAATATRDYVR